jgi:hypothetical protein
MTDSERFELWFRFINGKRLMYKSLTQNWVYGYDVL